MQICLHSLSSKHGWWTSHQRCLMLCLMKMVRWQSKRCSLKCSLVKSINCFYYSKRVTWTMTSSNIVVYTHGKYKTFAVKSHYKCLSWHYWVHGSEYICLSWPSRYDLIRFNLSLCLSSPFRRRSLRSQESNSPLSAISRVRAPWHPYLIIHGSMTLRNYPTRWIYEVFYWESTRAKKSTTCESFSIEC